MSERIPQFGGTMAESYERYFVPLLFEPYARDLAGRLPARFEGGVLELACGTGAVTRVLVTRLGSKGKIEATDLSEAMLEYARENQGHDSRVNWQTADALTLPFENAQFDFVVHQFGAMFFPDKPQAFREARRVLRPGGKFIFNVWGEMEDNPVFHSIELGLRGLFPEEETPILPTPCNMADPSLVSGLLKEAGFESVRVDRVQFAVHGFPALDVFHGFAQGTPVGSFLREKGVSLEEALAATLPGIAGMLGDPIDTSMVAFVFEAQ